MKSILIRAIGIAQWPGRRTTWLVSGGLAGRRRASRPIAFSSPSREEGHDIVACVRHGVQWFTFDNPDEIPKLRLHAPDANVLLRVAIRNENCVVDLGAKYGVRDDEALALLLQARAAGLNVRGIAFHVGSQSLDPGIYLTALKVVRRLFDDAAAAGGRLDTLDLGGRFPGV